MNRHEALTALAATSASGLFIASASRSGRETATDIVEIIETDWEVRPGLTVRTKTYGGIVPGRVLRFHEGQRVAIAVRNRTNQKQTVHWHGLIVSDAVDGAVETGTAPVSAAGEHTYAFRVTPGGTRWYHSHYGEALFSGMFGPLIIDRKDERGDYDREVILVLHEFKHHIPSKGSMMESRPPGSPTLSAPAMSMQKMLQNAGGMGNGSGMMGGMMQGNAGMMQGSGGMMGPGMLMHDATYSAYAINGKALGAGEPIRVKCGERVRFRIINASATLTHRLALPGHRFLVTELDGNPVANPRLVDAVELGVGERVDAIVTMDTPGQWVFGSTVKQERDLGMGVVIAYGGSHGQAIWRDESRDAFTYQHFGAGGVPVHVERTFDLVLRKFPGGPNAWSINGRRFPNTTPLRVREGGHYLIHFTNMSMMEHPMHLHGHRFELVSVDGVAMSGVRKDTIVVRPMMGRADILLRANNPDRGRFLLHCHNQQHMDGGMMTILSYA